MAIIDPIPASELGTTYTHYGLFAWLVPVYIGKPESDAPLVTERNWVPVWWFMAVEAAFGALCTVACALNPDFEPMFPIIITGEIGK